MKVLVVGIFVFLGILTAILIGLYLFKSGGINNLPQSRVSSVENITTSTTNPTITLSVSDKSVFEKLLSDTGWNQGKNITLLNGQLIETEAVNTINIEYSDSPQSYLQQQYGEDGSVFASVDTRFNNGILIVTIHVDPQEIKNTEGEGAKNWLINHQVIRALNKIANPNASQKELTDIDLVLFEKYRNQNLINLDQG